MPPEFTLEVEKRGSLAAVFVRMAMTSPPTAPSGKFQGGGNLPGEPSKYTYDKNSKTNIANVLPERQ